MEKITKEQIKELAFKARIELDSEQIELLKKEFEDLIFPSLEVLNKFDLNKLKPLRYPDIQSNSKLREDNLISEDIIKTNKNLIKNNRLIKEKLNLYLISKKK